MTDERKKEITDRYLHSGSDETLMELSVQEMIFLYSAVLDELKKDEKNEEMLQRRQYVFSSIIIRLVNSDSIYIAYHVMTGYPYIDVKGNAWVFSEKEFSKAAHHHYFELGVPLTMREITKENILNEMVELYRLGIETVILDNGQQSVDILRRDILREPETGYGDAVHPELMFTILSGAELAYASDGKHPSLPENDKKIKQLIKESNLLVPVKTEHHLEDGQVMHISDATPSQIAIVNPYGGPGGFVAAFTDWREFTKVYSKDEWNAAVMNYEALRDAASHAAGFVINPGGISFSVGNSVMD